MYRSAYTKTLLYLLALVAFCSCTEPFDLETNEFSDILVINASITSENKHHEIYISRSFATGEEAKLVSGAGVSIQNEAGNSIRFNETEAGTYTSEIPFSPERGISYQLRVIDENNETFVSDAVMLTQPSKIDQVMPKRITNKQGEDGVEIYVDGTGLNDHEGYFRYAFEETYKIESFYKPLKEFVVVSQSPPTLELTDKENEERICYVDETSNTVVIAETRNLAENKVRALPVHFIERRDRKVALRYSILVKQFSLTASSYEFYKTLKEFSSNDNLFTQTQPGLIVGNIKHENNPNIKVIGLFEMVAIDTKRIFFNFRDIFGNDMPYFESCESQAYGLSNPELFNRILSGNFQFTGEDPPEVYNIAPIDCIDCTLEGSNRIPEFWTEE